MQAVTIHEFGDPKKVATVETVPIPQISDSQVLVKLRYAPIHNHNWLTVAGLYGIRPQLPHVDGSEGFGYVEKVGSAVKSLKKGDRVAVARTMGSWAEYFVAEELATIKVPESIDDITAAQFSGMPLSAVLLLDSLGLESGDWFAYDGANGVVGKIIAQAAKARGINMLKIVRRESAKTELQELGFSHVVVYPSASFDESVASILGQAPLKAAVDNVSGEIANVLLKMLDHDGTLVIFGRLTDEPLPFNSREFIFSHKRVVGFWVTKHLETISNEDLARAKKEALEYFTAGNFQLPAGHVYPLDQCREALAANTTAKAGKILFEPRHGNKSED